MTGLGIEELEVPLVLAPMAGGPSTVALAGAVCEAGGLGFLAAGYISAERLDGEIGALRASTGRSFGVNIFAPGRGDVEEDGLAEYLGRLAGEAERYGVELGEPRMDDDEWAAKLEIVRERRPAVVSFTFGCPTRELSAELHDLGIGVWVTVTTPEEAEEAERAGASALVVQGIEAGGHRGGFGDPECGEGYGLLALLREVSWRSELPLIAAGGVSDGPALAAALCAGAVAGQAGSAFLLAKEAGTHPAHRAALKEGRPTGLTRAFSGRLARGIVNRFMVEHAGEAPAAYPQIHHATSPLRGAARARGDGDGFNLWAGQAHHLARALPAGEIVRRFAREADRALTGTTSALEPQQRG